MHGLQHCLLGIGNPLLDIISTVGPEFLNKYEIQPANQILAEEKHLPMFQELAAHQGAEFIAGGATQNSIRVAQWMLQIPEASSYVGCIGKDEFGEKMAAVARAVGVNAQYMIDPATPTGTCAVCVLDKERSLVANLGAANNLKYDFVKEKTIWGTVEKARVIYSAGFFITVSPETIAATAKHCADTGKIYCMNISATFLVQVPPFKKVLLETMPYVDYLFGNELEARALAEAEGWGTEDLACIAKKVASLPKQNGGRGRTVVITHGSEPTVVATDGHIRLFPAIPIAPSDIVDTNGAGDAFVGGFLSQLVVGKALDECIRAANYAANIVIQRSGCSLPVQPDFIWQ